MCKSYIDYVNIKELISYLQDAVTFLSRKKLQVIKKLALSNMIYKEKFTLNTTLFY